MEDADGKCAPRRLHLGHGSFTQYRQQERSWKEAPEVGGFRTQLSKREDGGSDEVVCNACSIGHVAAYVF